MANERQPRLEKRGIVHEKPKQTQTLGMDKNPNHWHGAVYAYSYQP